MHGIILYGPPAAGKDTITRALGKLDERYVLFPRLKAGAGKTAGYRMTTESTVDILRAKNEIVWENRRYGAIYVVDQPLLLQQLADHVPVLHLGQVEAIDAVVRTASIARWLVVYVWCPRDVAAKRIITRGNGNVNARLRAWDETKHLRNAHMTINTAETSADEAAQRIHDFLIHHQIA